MLTYKFVGGKQNGNDCFLNESRPDGFEWDSWPAGRYRVVKSGQAGSKYSGYAVCVDPALPFSQQSIPSPKPEPSSRWTVSFGGDIVVPIIADRYEVLNNILWFYTENDEEVASFRYWNYVKRDTP